MTVAQSKCNSCEYRKDYAHPNPYGKEYCSMGIGISGKGFLPFKDSCKSWKEKGSVIIPPVNVVRTPPVIEGRMVESGDKGRVTRYWKLP